MDHDQGRAGRTEGEAALRKTLIACCAALLLGSTAAFGVSEPEMRVAALIAVMDADLVRPDTPGRHARLLESASLLPIMLREVQANRDEVERARSLYRIISERKTDKALIAVRTLAAAHPFRPFPAPAGRQRLLALGRAIHAQACAGCHDHPNPAALLPAENLYRLACEEAPPALEARLFLGVKGMAEQGHRNPFSPEEQTALSFWYRNAGWKCHAEKPGSGHTPANRQE